MMGGAIAEWSKALLVRENKRNTKTIPGSPPPGLGNLKKIDDPYVNIEFPLSPDNLGSNPRRFCSIAILDTFEIYT